MAQSTAPQPALIELLLIGSIRPDKANARSHSSRQIAKMAASVERLGFNVPIIIDETTKVLAATPVCS